MRKDIRLHDQATKVFLVGILMYVATLTVSFYSGATVLGLVMLSPGALLGLGAPILQLPWLVFWLLSIGRPQGSGISGMLLLIHQLSAVVIVNCMWDRGNLFGRLNGKGWLPLFAFVANVIAIIYFEIWLWHIVLRPSGKEPTNTSSKKT